MPDLFISAPPPYIEKFSFPMNSVHSAWQFRELMLTKKEINRELNIMVTVE